MIKLGSTAPEYTLEYSIKSRMTGKIVLFFKSISQSCFFPPPPFIPVCYFVGTVLLYTCQLLKSLCFINFEVLQLQTVKSALLLPRWGSCPTASNTVYKVRWAVSHSPLGKQCSYHRKLYFWNTLLGLLFFKKSLNWWHHLLFRFFFPFHNNVYYIDACFF